MERYNSRPTMSGGAQTDNITQYAWAEELSPPRWDRHTLTGALYAAEDDNLKMALENTFLVEQIVHVKTKNEKLVNKNKCLQKKLDTANQNVNSLETALEATKTGQDEWKQTEEWGAILRQMEADCERMVRQLQEQITERDTVINNIRDGIKVYTEDFLIFSTQLKQNLDGCNAIDEEFNKQLAEREESWEARLKERERLWLEKEDTLMKRASHAEEELKLMMIKNIQLQELALKKKRKKGFWGKKKPCSSKEEKAAGETAQAGKEEKKEEEKVKKWGFWHKKKQRSNSEEEEEEEAAVCQAQAGQEEETKEKKRGFWSWARKKESTHSDRKEEEGAACPQAGHE